MNSGKYIRRQNSSKETAAMALDDATNDRVSIASRKRSQDGGSSSLDDKKDPSNRCQKGSGSSRRHGIGRPNSSGYQKSISKKKDKKPRNLKSELKGANAISLGKGTYDFPLRNGNVVDTELDRDSSAPKKEEEENQKVLHQDHRKARIQRILAESKTIGIKPPLDTLKEAMELGVIVTPPKHHHFQQQSISSNDEANNLAAPRPKAASAVQPPSSSPPPLPPLREMTTDDVKKALAALKNLNNTNPPASSLSHNNGIHMKDTATISTTSSNLSSDNRIHMVDGYASATKKQGFQECCPSPDSGERDAQTQLQQSSDTATNDLPHHSNQHDTSYDDHHTDKALLIHPKSRRTVSYEILVCCLGFIVVVLAVVLLPMALFTDVFTTKSTTAQPPESSVSPTTVAPSAAYIIPWPSPSQPSESSGSSQQHPPLVTPTSPVPWPSSPPSLQVTTTTPTFLPTTEPPQTNPPTSIIDAPLFEYLLSLGITSEVLQDPDTPQGRALRWLVMGSKTPVIDVIRDPERFAVMALEFSLNSNGYTDGLSLDRRADRDICNWQGVTCDRHRQHVKEIKWSNRGLRGYVIPEIGLLSKLEKVDLAQNLITGNLELFWDLPSLTHLYLFENRFTGTIPSKKPAPPDLKHVYLGSNQLTGTLPLTLASSTYGPQALRYLSLYRNKLRGTLPEGMLLRNLFYLDLSENQFSGSLPSDFVRNLVRLRILYLGNNNFSGRLPDNFPYLGDGRMKQLFLNDNAFSGKFPSGWSDTQMTNIDISNNQFHGADKDMCDLSIFEDGEMVEYRTDCDICQCDILCQTCTRNRT